MKIKGIMLAAAVALSAHVEAVSFIFKFRQDGWLTWGYMHPLGENGLELDYYLDGEYLQTGTTVNFQAWLPLDIETNHPDGMPQLALGTHQISFTHEGVEYFSPFYTVTLPTDPATHPSNTIPDGGTTALLLGLSAFGLFAARRHFTR